MKQEKYDVLLRKYNLLKKERDELLRENKFLRVYYDIDIRAREDLQRQMQLQELLLKHTIAHPQLTGRRGQWKGELGFDLLRAVARAKISGAKGTADAIRMIRKEPRWRGYKARYLAKCYVEAEHFFRPCLDQLRDLESRKFRSVANLNQH